MKIVIFFALLAVCAAQNRNAKPAKQPVQLPVQGRSKQPVQANPSAFAFPQFPAPIPVQARKNTPVQAKSDEEEPVRILKQSAILNDDGSYQHGFEAENGIKVEEAGSLKQITEEDAGTVSRGSYSYVEADGTVISVTWTADEKGFQAKGAHLPVAPPMPEHVVKMLKDLKAQGRL